MKAKSYSRNPPRRKNPKRRGIKTGEGATVSENKIVVLQRKLQFHPGLNVRSTRILFVYSFVYTELQK